MRLLIALLITILMCLSPEKTLALDSTVSGKVAGTQVASQSSSLASKLKDLQKEIASKAAQLKAQMTKKLQNKAYFGVIKEIADNKITIESTPLDKMITTNEYTNFNFQIVKGKKTPQVSLKDLAQGDFISALGDIDDKNVLTAKKLIKSSPIASGSAQFVWGQIQGVSNGTVVLNTKDNKKAFVFTNGQTKFYLGNEEASLLDAKITKFMVGKGNPNRDGNITATFIYFIPSIGFIRPEKKITSPSGTLISSPQPTPTPKKK